MKKIIAVLTVILLLLVFVALMFFRRAPFQYSGVIEAVETDVSSRLADTVKKLYVQEGDFVQKGALLAEFDCEDINSKTDFAKKEYERAAKLLRSSAGSAENYDKAAHLYDNARITQSWCKVSSPAEGKVLYKYIEEGELAAPGKKLFSVADMSVMDVWVYVEHDRLAGLSVKQELEGYLPEADKTFKGFISLINDKAEFTPKNVQTRSERTRLVYGIKTKFENDDKLTLKPGMTLEVKLQD